MLTQKDLPKPDQIVHFEAYSKGDHPTPEKTGALMVFGDPSAKKMALLCAGFPDDHTVFLPFAKKMSDSNKMLVGVMCLPGYDDRPEDGVGWETHPPEGFSVNDLSQTVRAAANALRGLSTLKGGKPEFVGIFHDWGSVAGSLWAKEVEEESGEESAKPDKMVYFDVLMGPPTWANDDPVPDDKLQNPGLFARVCEVYQPVLAFNSMLFTYVSKYVGATNLIVSMLSLGITQLLPCYISDNNDELYGTTKPGLLRTTYMTCLYRSMYTDFYLKGKRSLAFLHEDWKKTPILYLYGTDKRASFHDPTSFALLERESAEKRSLSKVAAIEGAGHYFYNQKQEETLEHVLGFVNAENTFRNNTK